MFSSAHWGHSVGDISSLGPWQLRPIHCFWSGSSSETKSHEAHETKQTVLSKQTLLLQILISPSSCLRTSAQRRKLVVLPDQVRVPLPLATVASPDTWVQATTLTSKPCAAFVAGLTEGTLRIMSTSDDTRRGPRPNSPMYSLMPLPLATAARGWKVKNERWNIYNI